VITLNILSKYVLVMELRFDAMLYSDMGNENSDAGHVKCSRGPQVPYHWFRPSLLSSLGPVAADSLQQ